MIAADGTSILLAPSAIQVIEHKDADEPVTARLDATSQVSSRSGKLVWPGPMTNNF